MRGVYLSDCNTPKTRLITIFAGMQELENYLDYEAHLRLYGNMRRIAQTCSKYEHMRREIEGIVVQPVLEQHSRVLEATEQETDETASLGEALVESGLPLDLHKTPEEIQARREKHKKAAEARARGKQVDLFDFLEYDGLPWG